MKTEDNVTPCTGALYVGGCPLPIENPIPVINPARLSEVVGTIPAGSVREARQAISVAHDAFAAWSALPIRERARRLALAGEALMPGMDARAVLLSRENGKIQREAWLDCMGAKKCTDYYVEVAKEFKLERDLPAPNGRVMVTRRAMGVTAIIVPWNAPVILAFLGIAPALIAGNTVVVKPSSFAPLALIDSIRVMAEKLPPGVLNVVTGEGEVGAELCTHRLVRRVMFTGSVGVGAKVLQNASATFKRCTMELGGNDPALVLADADLDHTVPGLLKAVFTGSGQVCYDVKRIHVHKSLYAKFVDRFTEAANNIVVGDGLDPHVTMGPLTTAHQFQFVNALIAETKSGHGKVVEVGKKAVSGAAWENGYFIRPHIVTGVDHSDRVVRCEQFGPVIPIMPFSDEEEAIRFANETEFGLASSIWTADIDRGWRLAGRIDAGSAFINTHAMASAVDMPFGGFKSSGLGRGHGEVALEEQFELQTISTRRTDQS